MENYILNVNTDKVLGNIKPMHAVNNAPSFVNEKLLQTMKDAGIPYSRLHDSFMNSMNKFVDVPKVFPDFDADENDENSYDFAYTDYYLANLIKFGVKPFYRLGTSIENYSGIIKPYYIYPPKDNLKWAKICEHIIMHYNEGWANGFHYNIEHWEIWNEPENYENPKENNMWLGTKTQFFELYYVASTYLKKRFPDLKIGGYASCGFYAVAEKAANPDANVSPRVEYFISFFKDFLAYISDEKHKAPLDFFSWHSYSGVKENVLYADYCRKVLDEYGFVNTEHYLNEWNPGIRVRGQLIDSSNIISNMLALQNTSLDMMMYYDLRANCGYSGPYNPLTCAMPDVQNAKDYVFKAYYAFNAWNELYRLKNQIEVTGFGDNVYAVAGFNGERGAIVIANNGDEKITVQIDGIEIKEVLLLSAEKDLENTAVGKRLRLNSYETAVIRF